MECLLCKGQIKQHASRSLNRSADYHFERKCPGFPYKQWGHHRPIMAKNPRAPTEGIIASKDFDEWKVEVNESEPTVTTVRDGEVSVTLKYKVAIHKHPTTAWTGKCIVVELFSIEGEDQQAVGVKVLRKLQDVASENHWGVVITDIESDLWLRSLQGDAYGTPNTTSSQLARPDAYQQMSRSSSRDVVSMMRVDLRILMLLGLTEMVKSEGPTTVKLTKDQIVSIVPYKVNIGDIPMDIMAQMILHAGDKAPFAMSAGAVAQTKLGSNNLLSIAQDNDYEGIVVAIGSVDRANMESDPLGSSNGLVKLKSLARIRTREEQTYLTLMDTKIPPEDEVVGPLVMWTYYKFTPTTFNTWASSQRVALKKLATPEEEDAIPSISMNDAFALRFQYTQNGDTELSVRQPVAYAWTPNHKWDEAPRWENIPSDNLENFRDKLNKNMGDKDSVTVRVLYQLD